MRLQPPHGAVRLRQATALLAMCAAALLLARPAGAAAPDDDLGGQMRATAGGRTVQLPMLKTEITADVSGTTATVTVEQTFANPTSVPLNATYLFPLNKDAAVHAMQMRVGDELISALIKRREEARQSFEAAKQQGKAAALLEQHRPNMFTQDVANLMPGQPVKVTLKYVQALSRIDGAYRLAVPLVVGPRYIPTARGPLQLATGVDRETDDTERGPSEPTGDSTGSAPNVTPTTDGQWSLGPVPKYPPVAGLTMPKLIEADRVSIRVNLSAGLPILDVSSATHAIDVARKDTSHAVTLKSGRTIDNRDFVLDYKIGGEAVTAGVLTHREADGGYLSLLIEPPANVAAEEVTPREIVFVLDTSGSMNGKPMAASKAFMRQALSMLTTSDYFRIIRFANNASEFTAAPVRATAENVERARGFVENLAASGGTEVMPALTQAFGIRQAAGTRRMIVFLSDGYVGNEQDILRMVAGHIGQARTYVLGVGTAVNRYLLAEMAHLGRGFMRVIDPTEQVEDAAVTFANKLSTTVMTDVAVDWGTLKISDLAPGRLPDLFAGDSLSIHGRFTGGGTHQIRIKGKIAGRDAVMPISVTLPEEATGEATRAIPLTWARATIKDEMRQLMTPRRLRSAERDDSAIRERITQLGLAHALVTQWTSFVAISQRIVNDDPNAAVAAKVPLPMVEGVGPEAYGKRMIQASGSAGTRVVHSGGAQTPGVTQGFTGTFAGGATPEPETLIGLLVVILGLAAGLIRRRAA